MNKDFVLWCVFALWIICSIVSAYHIITTSNFIWPFGMGIAWISGFIWIRELTFRRSEKK